MPTDPQTTDWPPERQGLLRRPCSALPPGHRHCRHGHTEDCPDPGECPLEEA